jgi:pyrimidine-nucleoside phosphorylase
MFDVIAKKRDGIELSRDEIEYFITGYSEGTIPDYQASALLMAIFLRGMNRRETADLTDIMASSGDRINLDAIEGIKVDKHSTGGVGDKTTLIIGPIVAACGIPVAKMSGRGLGHTGGTIDKLESIKGFRTSLTSREFISQVMDIGIAIAGQTGNLAPADKKLYALRDVTATINSIPLIASSIMSKKIASGADRILLDVKTGSGAFMKTVDDSINLAEEMISIGNRIGKKTAALITDMNAPLGNAIGNALEVEEAIQTLMGEGPRDLEVISLEIASRMLEFAGTGTIEECRKAAEKVLRDGSALEKFKDMLENQGGRFSENLAEIFVSRAQHQLDVKSDCSAYIKAINTEQIGIASMLLGAGRETKDSTIDYSAGIKLYKKPGEKIKKGECIAKLYTNRPEKAEEAARLMLNAVEIVDTPPDIGPLILAYMDGEKIIRY